MSSFLMKEELMRIRDRRWPRALVLVFLLLIGVPGCAGDNIVGDQIPQVQVDYFRALSNTKYWTRTAVNIVISDEDSTEVTLLDKVQSGNEAYLSFKDFSVTQGTTERPAAAYVAVTGSDGTSSLATTNIGVTSANMAVLQGALKNMESEKTRTQRLETERRAKEAAALLKKQTIELEHAMKDAKALQQKGRFRDAMVLLDSMRANLQWSYEQIALYDQLQGSEVDRILRQCQVKNNEFDKLQSFLPNRLSQGSQPFRFYPCLIKDGSNKFWALSLLLLRDDWLFANQVQVIVDGTVYSTVTKEYFSSDVSRDVLDNGRVKESILFSQTDAGSNALFQAITGYTGTSALKIRVNGEEGYSEHSLSLADVEVWRDMLLLYSHLNDYTFSN
jgi:hypothetical protein